MALDWLSFLDRHRIDYEIERPGNASIRCPWCGSADPSKHMGISLNGKGYNCWREREHRGRNPARLIMALIGCSYNEAAKIAGVEHISVPDDFDARMRALAEPQQEHEDWALDMPDEFKRFDTRSPLADSFAAYLVCKRGFHPATVYNDFTKRYGVYYALRGQFRYRIIFTVHHQGKLVGWTGRALSGKAGLRYKALGCDENDGPSAPRPITSYLLWYDDFRKRTGEVLVLCEGPFDALKLRVLGRERGYAVDATCFFRSDPTDDQIGLLHDLCPRYRRKILLLDQGTMHTMMSVSADLVSLGVEPLMLPDGVKDPGDLRSIDFLLDHLQAGA